MARLKELRLSEAARKLREHRYQKRSVREISELWDLEVLKIFAVLSKVILV